MKLIEYLGKPQSLKEIKNTLLQNKKGRTYLNQFEKEHYYDKEEGLDEMSERVQYWIIVSLLKWIKFQSNNLSSVVKEFLWIKPKQKNNTST